MLVAFQPLRRNPDVRDLQSCCVAFDATGQRPSRLHCCLHLQRTVVPPKYDIRVILIEQSGASILREVAEFIAFIADIYIAPLQVELLRSAHNPSAAE